MAKNVSLVTAEMQPVVQATLAKINQKYAEDQSILTEESKAKLDQVIAMM